MATHLIIPTVLTFCLLWSCRFSAHAQVTTARSAADPIAVTWADMTVRVMTKAPKNTPTYGSRAIGYLGLTMYETVLYASAHHQSVFKKISGTYALPKPDRHKAYCWELALNAGQAYMLKALYSYTQKEQLIDSLETVLRQRYTSRLSPDVVERSEQFGRAVASIIYDWSKTDGGHQGYDRNFPPDFVWPNGEGLWTPPLVGQSKSKLPLHPTWGQNRTFSVRNGKLPLPKPLAYSTNPTSQYYNQCKEVLERKKTLTSADQATVMWWGDDPTETCSPPGHSYNLATIAIRTSQATLVKAAETYARVGMAVADAFVCCWKVKFTFMVQRPSTFIQDNFNPTRSWGPWLPFFLEPPFPSFYSGHAVQSAATATVLTELYGDAFFFTDNTHLNRLEDVYTYPSTALAKPGHPDPQMVAYVLTNKGKGRHYQSFWEAAQECAESRLMGGIHTRYENEVGLAEGAKIGRNINSLRWHLINVVRPFRKRPV
ncbi:vanadium-dependent haloperoxidase [Fibrivirga algicola]|uniref:Vanadium-dependent haloperoxidase n=1 Tax=Fibrivirga algicola TaxID=2950420 RepID=A0ABX0QK59_9BACT|nr:vanadium-dependent haloperoxidase [Fibrivirga algicola]NID12834.1 vanadium-dependent haloperoxidase [Fibrivirga algicola]